MIWILINNDYQLIDIKKKIRNIKDRKFSLIIVKHRLNIDISLDEFESVIEVDKFGYSWKYLLNILYYKKIKMYLNKNIKISNDDKLIIYTEYDLFNQYIIELFKVRNLSVIAMEDGMATAVLYSIDVKPISINYRLKEFYIRKLLSIKSFRYIYNGTRIYPAMIDNMIDLICTSKNILNKRDIKSVIINNGAQKIAKLDERKAIFLNQPIYTKANFNEYLNQLEKLIIEISVNIDNLYFKFHPREEDSFRKEINKRLAMISKVEVIISNDLVEESIYEIKPKYAISFHSASLLNLYDLGLEPIFAYHKFKLIQSDYSLNQLDQYLNNIEYKFIDNFNELMLGYNSNINNKYNKTKLEDLI